MRNIFFGIFFSLSDYIFFNIYVICMLYSTQIRSQKVWVVYVCYRFILEQCEIERREKTKWSRLKIVSYESTFMDIIMTFFVKSLLNPLGLLSSRDKKFILAQNRDRRHQTSERIVFELVVRMGTLKVS